MEIYREFDLNRTLMIFYKERHFQQKQIQNITIRIYPLIDYKSIYKGQIRN